MKIFASAALLCLLFNPAPGQVQAQTVRRSPPETFMVRQIKHLDEFVTRFNGDSSVGLQQENDRITNLRSLFDEDDSRFIVDKNPYSPYTTLVTNFIANVSQQHIKLPQKLPLEATVRILAQTAHHRDTLTIRLKKEYTADSAAFWHIVQVTRPPLLRDSLQSECNDTFKHIDLPPNAHEVSFLPLLRGIHDYNSLCPFTRCRACVDEPWKQTEYALQKKILTVEAVESTVIHLNIGDQWQLTLREFLREKDNSGWLISDLTEL